MQKNRHAVALGKLGAKARNKVLDGDQRIAIATLAGKAGGKARAVSLTAERRSEIARKAGKAGAAARWGKKAKQ